MAINLIQGVNLECVECDPAVADRFACLFRSTWDSLPGGIRQIAQLHWLSRNDSPHIGFGPFEWNPKKGNIGGQVQERGHVIDYNSNIYELADERLFSAAIAHELSHVLFHALDQPQHVWLGSQADKIATEILAFELTRRMGFAQDEFFEWLNCEVSTKGPYLRQDRGEEVVDSDSIWQRWAQLEQHWATENRECQGESLDDVKSAFYDEHSKYFDVAMKCADKSDWNDISEVKGLVANKQ